jgi:O-methyltransferase involved in polyketide biosynthesis
VLDPQPQWIEDLLAVGFIPGSSAEEIAARREELNAEVWRYMRADIINRDRAAENELESAVRNGIEQYVLLGAGFDTFPYRQPVWARSLSIIEVDHPTSQALKRECLAARELAIPANVEVAFFNHASVGQRLKLTIYSHLSITPSTCSLRDLHTNRA